MQHGRDMSADKKLRDTRITIEIVRQLKRAGLYSRPSGFVQPPAAEARRSIERLRIKLPEGLPDIPTVTEARGISRRLAPFAGLPSVDMTIRWLEAINQEPPVHANPDSWRCASEAFDLMEALCVAQPSTYRQGPFVQIATLLLESLTGERADLYQVCRAVLRARQKFGRGVKPPPEKRAAE
jgi:hypothetical protein